MIQSPITGSTNTSLEKEIQSYKVIQLYADALKIDVSDYLQNTPHISIYRCNDSQYRFYYPFTIAGDGRFYEHLMQYDWYYMPWKWEHQQTIQWLQPGMKVIEVGSGEGDYVARIQRQHKVVAIGLELNQSALTKAKSKNIDIRNETVQKHVENNAEEYDIVCMFQVLEHITDVRSFLLACINCLKKKGKLIISVPNNNGFISYAENDALNSPPHHMGIWDEQSLTSLENFFPIKLLQVNYEPLQLYHQKYYTYVISQYYSKKYFIPARIVSYIILIIQRFHLFKFKGHTIQVIFQKT